MVGRVVIVVIGLAVFGFIFNSLKHATDPANNALRIVAGNGETTTETQGRSVFRGGLGGTSDARMDDVLCRWSGREVVVTALITSTSSQRVTFRWQPYYQLQGQNRRFGVDDPALEQVRKLEPHKSVTVEARERPAGVPPGTGITACEPAFYTSPG